MGITVSDCYNTAQFRRLAKARLPGPIFHYIDGAADDEVTYSRGSRPVSVGRWTAESARSGERGVSRSRESEARKSSEAAWTGTADAARSSALSALAFGSTQSIL